MRCCLQSARARTVDENGAPHRCAAQSALAPQSDAHPAAETEATPMGHHPVAALPKDAAIAITYPGSRAPSLCAGNPGARSRLSLLGRPGASGSEDTHDLCDSRAVGNGGGSRRRVGIARCARDPAAVRRDLARRCASCGPDGALFSGRAQYQAALRSIPRRSLDTVAPFAICVHQVSCRCRRLLKIAPDVCGGNALCRSTHICVCYILSEAGY